MSYKTFEDMKHDIPEGATHHGIHGCDTDCYFKKDGDKFLLWRHENWSISPFAHHNWVKPIPKNSQSQDWNGEGLLHVEWKNGDKCQYKNQDDEWNEYSGRYVCFDSYADCHVIYACDATLYHANGDQIRKPETPQQREERERLEAVKLMCDEIGKLPFGDTLEAMSTLYDLGYRKAK